MKLAPWSIARWTVRIASSSLIARNTPPSEEAPKLSAGTERPVLPSGRRSTCAKYADGSARRNASDAVEAAARRDCEKIRRVFGWRRPVVCAADLMKLRILFTLLGPSWL